MFLTQFKRFSLVLSSTSIALATFLIIPQKARAADCAPSNTVTTLGANAECAGTPDRFQLTIYEMGICTSHPLSGNQNAKSVSLTSCVATMSRSTAGVSGDLGGSSSFNLPGAVTRPPNGTYPYAYIVVGNTFGLKGSYKLQGGDTYYSTSDGGVNTTGPAVNHDETIDSFDNPFDAEWGTDDSNPQTVSGGGAVQALLLSNHENYTRATGGDVTRLFGAFTAPSGAEVVITDGTNGLNVELQVTNAGYTIVANGSGEPDEFGPGPFKPVFTVE